MCNAVLDFGAQTSGTNSLIEDSVKTFRAEEILVQGIGDPFFLMCSTAGPALQICHQGWECLKPVYSVTLIADLPD